MDILWQYQFRIILLGDSTVGKSSLLKRFTDGIYSDVADPTVGVDFYARSLDIEPGVKIKLQLWDTAGQERFRYNTRQNKTTQHRRYFYVPFGIYRQISARPPRDDAIGCYYRIKAFKLN